MPSHSTALIVLAVWFAICALTLVIRRRRRRQPDALEGSAIGAWGPGSPANALQGDADE
jgi:hypothetical protein